MRLRDYIHPGWFRLIDWWRAERERVAEAESAWEADDRRLGVLDTPIGDLPTRFGFAQLRRTALRESGIDEDKLWPVGWDEIADPYGTLEKKGVGPGSILRHDFTNELVRVDEKTTGGFKVTRSFGAVPMPKIPKPLHWSSMTAVRYIDGLGVVGPERGA
jgi:hypothetical protein